MPCRASRDRDRPKGESLAYGCLRAQPLGKVAVPMRRGDYPPTRAGAASAAARARVGGTTTKPGGRPRGARANRAAPTPAAPLRLKGEGAMTSRGAKSSGKEREDNPCEQAESCRR